jgi:hypothetical protein
VFLPQFGECCGTWYILCSFGIFFPRFGIFYQEKIWQPRSVFAASDKTPPPPTPLPDPCLEISQNRLLLNYDEFFLAPRVSLFANFEAGLPDVIHIFRPKIAVWVNLGGNALEAVGIFY